MENHAVYTKLAAIQQELKAPKGQYNSFGKYKYRSCEDILEAVKPLCAKNNAALVISDELCQIGGRFYVIAHARLYDCETGAWHETQAFAREPDDKKGMDESQITGTASSYARKYALNGLFCIDDTKDADTDEYKAQTDAGAKKSKKPMQSYRHVDPLPEPPAEPVQIAECGCCHKPLYSVGDGAKKNGVVYCKDCIKAGKV